MKNALLQGGLTFAISCVMAGALIAQEPARQPRPQPLPADQDQPRADDARMVTVTGCLKEEKDVPGGQPNVAERSGLGEDFILTKAKVLKGSAEPSDGAPADPQAGASPRTGQGAMFKIEGLDDEMLRSHINQQVQVQGRFQDRTLLTPDLSNPPTGERQTAPDEVQAIRATSIKMIAATCTTGTN